MLGGSSQAPVMVDLALVALTFAFFAASVAYLRGCEKL
jgi:hypothetical protein